MEAARPAARAECRAVPMARPAHLPSADGQVWVPRSLSAVKSECREYWLLRASLFGRFNIDSINIDINITIDVDGK